MLEVKGVEPAIPNEQLAFFLKELMGAEEYEKYAKEKEAETVESVELKSAEKVAEKVVSDKPKKKSKPKTPRVKLPVSKDQRLLVTLGDKLETLQLESDVPTDKKEFLEALAKAPKKIQNRVVYFLEYIFGVREVLPTVLKIAVELLNKDGYVSAVNRMNFRGNLYQKLIDYPYSPDSASAMGQNTVKAMQFLKLVVPDANGLLRVNPASKYIGGLFHRVVG